MEDAPPRRDLGALLRFVGGMLGLALLVAFAALAIARGSDIGAQRIDYEQANRSPSSAHPLGTDPQGRDELDRMGHGLRQTARVSAIATALIGGFAVLVGVCALLVRTVLPDARSTRWLVGVGAGVAWLLFVHWVWRLPVVSEVRGESIPWKIVHAVHDATLAQVSARLFALTCIGVAISIALGGLRFDGAHRRRTIRHVLGAFALLFGLGCASLAVVELIGMLELGPPRPSLIGIFAVEYRYHELHGWLSWPALATIGLILVACALVATWLMASRASDLDRPDTSAVYHRAALALTCFGIAVALTRQLLLPTITADTARWMQWLAAITTIAALFVLVAGRGRRNLRPLDLSTATFFVIGAAVAVALHWPAQRNVEDRVWPDLGRYFEATALLFPGRDR